jgi:predicted NBD/HSP70 family sugar kinase
VGTGLVTQSGFQTGRRGRAGINYSLRDDLGAAVAISASPAGLLAQTTDIRGQIVEEITRPVPTPVTAAQLDPLLLELARAVASSAPGPIRGAALSLAGPVDRASGRLVHLPDSPFLVDELDARKLLSDLLGPDLHVDNDVNWAALAEYHDGSAVELEDFCYCYLGHGLGGAVVRSGEIVRGSRGLAGEIAHLRTVGPRGRSMRLVECFDAWNLLLPGSTAIDVPRVSSLLEGRTATDRRTRDAIVTAVATAIESVTALLNPEAVIIGGPWSRAGDFHRLLAERVHGGAIIDTEIRLAALDDRAPLVGARVAAVRSAQLRLFGVPH